MIAAENRLVKDRQKALGELLVSECRSAEPVIAALSAMVENGADVCYGNSKPLYWAAKNLNFSVVKFLIEHGALAHPASINYVADMCEKKGFGEKHEDDFFALLDVCRKKAGADYMTLFTPYINGMAVAGRADKLKMLMNRYYLTEAEVAGCIYTRIIFEVVLQCHDEVLGLINRHVKWQTAENFNLAVRTGDWVVLEYMLGHGSLYPPEESAVCAAIMGGFFEVLDLLCANGFDFARKPLYLKKACRAAFGDAGTAAIAYLFAHGYTAEDCYDGLSITQNAQKDGNDKLLEFLRTYDGQTSAKSENPPAANEVAAAFTQTVGDEKTVPSQTAIIGEQIETAQTQSCEQIEKTQKTDGQTEESPADSWIVTILEKHFEDAQMFETSYSDLGEQQLKMLSDANDREALAETGLRYMKKGDNTAVRYLYFSMQLGYVPACKALGDLYLQQGDTERAIEAYREGRRGGDDGAAYAWATLAIFKGDGEAYDLVLGLAQDGDRDAALVLEKFYREAGNKREAEYWKKRSARG